MSANNFGYNKNSLQFKNFSRVILNKIKLTTIANYKCLNSCYGGVTINYFKNL